MNSSMFGVDENKMDELSALLKELRTNSKGYIILEMDLRNSEEEVYSLISSINNLKTKNIELFDKAEKMIGIAKNLSAETNTIINDGNNNLPSASDIGLSSGAVVSSGASYTYSSSSGSYSSSDVGMSNSSSNISVDDKKAKENKVDVDDIVKNLLDLKISKEKFGGLTKAEAGKDYDYIVSIKNTNKDGKWAPNEIKEYYIKDGKVIGGLTGDGTYVKIEDGKLVIDKSDSEVFNKVVMSGVGVAGGYFATKTSYNNDTTKAIFKTVYPESTDEEYNNFVDSITKNGESYENAAKNVIENYKNGLSTNTETNTSEVTNNEMIANNEVNSGGVDESSTTSTSLENTEVNSSSTEVSEVKDSINVESLESSATSESVKETASKINNNDYLVMEDNVIKVDPKGLASELYAQASKLNNIEFKGELSSEVVFNESTANGLASYLNNKYSMNIDANTLMANIDNTVNAVSDSSLNVTTATADSAV